MTAEIIRKIRDGDRLSDAELNEAIDFYGRMEDGLRLLGPHFHLARVEVQRTHNTLQTYRYHRVN